MNHEAYTANLREMSNIITSTCEMVYFPAFWICIRWILSALRLSPSNHTLLQANIALEIQHYQHVNFSSHLSGKVREWDIRSLGLARGNKVKQALKSHEYTWSSSLRNWEFVSDVFCAREANYQYACKLWYMMYI